MRDFFRWAVENDLMHGDPTVGIRSPKKRAPAREIFSSTTGGVIVDANPRERDKVALLMLFRLGIRKGELRRFQFEHYDADRGAVRVCGKGGKWRTIPVEDAELRAVLNGYIAGLHPDPSDFLLYPERTGAVTWSDRTKADVRHRGSPVVACMPLARRDQALFRPRSSPSRFGPFP